MATVHGVELPTSPPLVRVPIIPSHKLHHRYRVRSRRHGYLDRHHEPHGFETAEEARAYAAEWQKRERAKPHHVPWLVRRSGDDAILFECELLDTETRAIERLPCGALK
jgi:hypothetical protein